MIRKCKIADLKDIVTLLNQLSQELNEENAYQLKDIKKQFKKLLKEKSNYENYVYIFDKKVVGFISILYYKSIFHRVGTALINELIIEKSYRGKGFGKELIEYAIQRAITKNMDEIEVGVMKENFSAIEFYKKNGFDEEYLLLGKEF